MDSLIRTSELEAVNTILAVMGESPINSLDVEGNLNIERAQSALREMSREVQSKGWYFNRDYEWSLPVNVDSKVPVPTNALECVPDGTAASKHYAHIGDFLYNITDQTYVFTAAVPCTITWFRDWTELPEGARRYILIRAARAAQERQVGSENMHKFTQDDEQHALTELVREQVRASRANMLTGSYTVWNAALRNRRI